MSVVNFLEFYIFVMIEGGMCDGIKIMFSVEGSMGFVKLLDYIGNKIFSFVVEYVCYVDQFVYNVFVFNCEMLV